LPLICIKKHLVNELTKPTVQSIWPND